MKIISNNSDVSALQAVICLRQLATDIWAKRKNVFDKSVDKEKAETAKKILSSSILNLIDTEYRQNIRSQIDAMLGLLIKGNPADHAPIFFSVSLKWIKNLTEDKDLKNSKIIFHLNTYELALQELSKKRLAISKDQYDNFLAQFISIVGVFIADITTSLKTTISSENGVLALNVYRKLIKVCLLMLTVRPCSMIIPNEIITFACQLINFSQEVLTIMVIAEEQTITKQLKKTINSIAIVCSFDLSSILNSCPMVLADKLTSVAPVWCQYFLHKWSSVSLQKATALLFYRLIKCFLFYSTPEILQEKGLNDRLRAESNLQQKAHQAYCLVLGNREFLQKSLMHVLFCFLLKNNATRNEEELENCDTSGGSLDEDDLGEDQQIERFIEEQETGGLESALNEMECSLSRIGRAIFEHLLHRFPAITIPIYHQMISESTSDTESLSILQRDTILSLIPLLEPIYENRKIPIEERLNLGIILGWLENQNTIIFQRRFLVILKIYLNSGGIIDLKSLIIRLTALLSSTDPVVRFESMNCLSTVVLKKSCDGEDTDFGALLSSVTPVFTSILSNSHNPGLLWKVGSYFLHILEKAQYNADDNTLRKLSELDFREVILHNPSAIKPILGDVFRYLLTGSSLSPFVHKVSAKYIKACFDTLKQEEVLGLLQFIGNFLRSLPSNLSRIEFTKEIIERLGPLAGRIMLAIEEDSCVQLLTIMEELLLLGTSRADLGIPSCLFELVNNIRSNDVSSSLFPIMTSTLSVFTTMLLQDLDTEVFTFEIYQPIFQIALRELFLDNEKTTVKLFFNLKTQALGFVSRLIILDVKKSLNFISKSKIIRL